MKNYSIEVNSAKINESGLSTQAGWITVYQAHPISREYIGANYEYLPIGVGIPADSYIDVPELPQAGLALKRSTDGKLWEHISDYRGQTVYNTETRFPMKVTDIGELQANQTLLAPTSEFDKWEDGQWVTDLAAQQQASIVNKKAELSTKLSQANERIQVLSDAVELNLATEEEKNELKAWKTYRLQLSRVDVNSVEAVFPLPPYLI
ncbi:tail fiber assembly protein [Pectobacterium carotovorum subsp. carotovorum]|nr:tail fiber assembly protein [Pectobacterium carotovorum]MBQ4794842.1 tail fiber assembly protein [Pectobacterium versatile]MCL6334532.1 tail fiber assembly protein [Pectobacterium carotovorum subsp. carotovorum]MCL6347794.1 tail fiber assembly protein [Pectobacterium carotovorum subsp. carotovorum]MCL6365300.1 tail fiber assembly protein [Pectobacterium carotovorum subsp. carotovorum]MCL6401575.1 tail fiber assembly protein [Pectobacterium carotovorum subsp. carotovorum]